MHGLGLRFEGPVALPDGPAWIGCAGAVIWPSDSSGTHDVDSDAVSILGTGDTVGVVVPGVCVAINSCKESAALRPVPIRGESDFSGLILDSCPVTVNVAGLSERLLVRVSCAWFVDPAREAVLTGAESLGSLPLIPNVRIF